MVPGRQLEALNLYCQPDPSVSIADEVASGISLVKHSASNTSEISSQDVSSLHSFSETTIKISRSWIRCELKCNSKKLFDYIKSRSNYIRYYSLFFVTLYNFIFIPLQVGLEIPFTGIFLALEILTILYYTLYAIQMVQRFKGITSEQKDRSSFIYHITV